MRMDIHVHSTYSRHWFWGRDALNTPKEMVKAAIKNGLGGIAITDHSTIKGSLVAKKYARNKNFIVITGIEIHSKSGDIIGLGIKENVPDNLSLEKTIEKIHNLSGIAIAPHPFAKYLFRKCLKEKAKKCDVIEVFNASCRKIHNKKALEFAKKFNKPKVAGSDAHSYRDIGRAGIICNSQKEDNILENIRKGKIEIFRDYTPYRNIMLLTLQKFSRSLKSRILRFS